MFTKFRLLLVAPVLAFVACLSFSAAAAADAAATDSASWVDLAKPVYDAFVGHHYAVGTCLFLVLAVALIKRYAGNVSRFGRFVHGDAGGSLLVLVGSTATALATTWGAPGAHVSLDTLKQGLLVGVSAAGGYTVLKSLIVEPVLKPLASKAPSWAQPIFAAVFFIFDHSPSASSSQAEANAAAAGAAAVAAKPAAGADGIAGAPTQVK